VRPDAAGASCAAQTNKVVQAHKQFKKQAEPMSAAKGMRGIVWENLMPMKAMQE